LPPDRDLVPSIRLGSGETVFHGRHGVVQALGELTEAFDDFRIEPREVL
jgi:hypothetical protein